MYRGQIEIGYGSNNALDISSDSSISSSSSHPNQGMDGSFVGAGGSIANGNSRKKVSSSSSIMGSPIGVGGSGHNSSNSNDQPNSNSRISKVSKFCGVCSDRAKSFHFGGLACDSCKAFFRRSVHNEAYTNFGCVYEGYCNITKNTRKGCQKCRFEKCLSIGMEKNWVMSEQERTLFNQQRMNKKKGSSSLDSSPRAAPPYEFEVSPRAKNERTAYEPEIANMINFMTDEEQTLIKKIVEDYRTAYIFIPYQVPKLTEGPRNSVQIIEMFTTILRRFAYFSKLIPEFKELDPEDQGKLLRESVLEMCLLRGALSFDLKNHRWPNTNMGFLHDCPQLEVKDIENLVCPELHALHMRFIQKIQTLKVDEPTVMLLLMVVLFYPDTVVQPNVQQKVMDAEFKYLTLLQKYVHWRYGPKDGTRLFPHLLTKMTDLRHLNDLHTEYNLKLAKDDVSAIKQDLAKLKLNPYPQWKIVNEKTGGVNGANGANGAGEMIVWPNPTIELSPGNLESIQGPICADVIVESATGHPRNPNSNHGLRGDQASQFINRRSPLTTPGVPLSGPRQKNAMAEVFLRRIPALIDDPFAPMITEAEILRFKEALAQGDLQLGGDLASYFNKSSPPIVPGDLPQPPAAQFVIDGNPLLAGLSPSQLEMAKRIQDSLSPEKRAEIRSMLTSSFGIFGGDVSSSLPESSSSSVTNCEETGIKSNEGSSNESFGAVEGVFTSGPQFQIQPHLLSTQSNFSWN